MILKHRLLKTGTRWPPDQRRQWVAVLIGDAEALTGFLQATVIGRREGMNERSREGRS